MHTLNKSLFTWTKILEVGKTYKIRSLIIDTEEIFTGNVKVKHFIFQLHL